MSERVWSGIPELPSNETGLLSLHHSKRLFTACGIAPCKKIGRKKWAQDNWNNDQDFISWYVSILVTKCIDNVSRTLIYLVSLGVLCCKLIQKNCLKRWNVKKEYLNLTPWFIFLGVFTVISWPWTSYMLMIWNFQILQMLRNNFFLFFGARQYK